MKSEVGHIAKPTADFGCVWFHSELSVWYQNGGNLLKMTYKSFEELPVWTELYERADDFFEQALPRLRGSFRNQLERAVLSVSNNIAEGFERGTTKELIQFIYIARGSAGEVRSMLSLVRRRPWATPFVDEIDEIKSLATSCARQLRGWADSLQNSEIKGQRHLNRATRQGFQDKREISDLKFEI